MFVGDDQYAVGLALNLPIFSGGLTQSQVRQAVASKEQSRALLEGARRSVERQTRDAYQGVMSGIASVRANQQAVKSNQTALESSQVGLQVGRLEGRRPIKRGLLTIDLTEAVVAEAKKENCQLIVAYHPPIFAPLTRLTDGAWKERALLACAEAGIAGLTFLRGIAMNPVIHAQLAAAPARSGTTAAKVCANVGRAERATAAD
mgnify:CR=1 FL=1